MSSTNQLACIDYKAPLHVQQNDYRTSSYLGHRYIPDPVQLPRAQDKRREYVCTVLGRKEMAYDFKSQQQVAYTNKFTEVSDRNPRLMLSSVHYMKHYDENVLNSAYRPVKPYESSYKADYEKKECINDNVMLNWTCPPRVKKSQVIINAALPGASKYLDLLATTNMLTYVQPQPDQTLSKTDAITLWNWLEFKKLKGGLKRELPENYIGKQETLCQDFPSQDCPKRRELQNEAKFVPHKGMTSESRSNYTLPQAKVDFNYEDVPCSILFTSPVNLMKPTTEAQMYGSKQRVQKYVDISGKEKKYVGTCHH